MPHRVLSLAEVADSLQMEEREVNHLVLQDEIPHLKQGERVTFRKIDIDSWASERLLDSSEKEVERFHKESSNKKYDLSKEHAIMPELLSASFINLNLESKTKKSILSDMVDLVVTSNSELVFSPEDLLSSLTNREETASTAINGGVALLHTKHHDEYLFGDSFIALGRSVQPIHFGSPDDSRTDIFFMLCCQADDIHLHVLARLCIMCYQTSLLWDLRNAESAEQAYDLVVAAEQEVIPVERCIFQLFILHY